MSTLNFRLAVAADAAACVELRGKTRENAIPAERLAAIGITPASWGADIASGRLPGHVCEDGSVLAGYCFGDTRTGEIVVLALLPQYENRGLGKELLSRAMNELRVRGHVRLFLGCARDPQKRSHGFYRHLGWRPTGEVDKHGDEVLEYDFVRASAPDS